MAEPPYKRSRPDDDRQAPRLDSRNPRDQRASRAEPERNGDRNRSYRSRSPERRDRDRGHGRDDRARDSVRDRRRDDPRDSRGSDRRDERRDAGRNRQDDRASNRDRGPNSDPRGPRDDARGYKRHREEEATMARSRSPRRDRSPQRTAKLDNNGFDRASTPEQGLPMRERNASRHPTPPVNVKFDLNKSRANSTERDSRRSSSVAAHEVNAANTYKPESSSIKKKAKPTAADFLGDAMVEDEEEDDVVIEEDPEMAAMQAMMGFGGFGTTKQKKVAGNDVGAVRKEKKTEYRQYMNRVGGFNRPLDEA